MRAHLHRTTSRRRTRSRELITTAATAATLALVLAACGGTDDATGTDDTDAGSDEAPTAEGAFPVTLEGALGTAEITEAPERVVTLGWGADDIAVSLGVVPVGVEADDWAGDENRLRPWFVDAVEEAGAELPEAITMYPELDVEAIVALEPDLVLAPQTGIDQATYDQLAAFTDVVAYPEGPWITPIDEQIEIVAAALGKPDEAAGLVDGIDQALADAAAENPDFAGTQIAYVYGGNEQGALSVYVPGDPRIDTLLGLGFELAPSVADLEPPAGSFTVDWGLENADRLDDVELLFTWFNTAEEQEVTEAQPLFASIPAFASGAYVPMLDTQLGMAVTTGTPLSVPWALDEYVPLIADAVAQVED
ncbi:ABC transporter substrate-binding protein [Oerskovia flava]|uniref:ABC transporter substrate-binding protein n=1 Tax=Oerskovia flava TaxID=2986422 RepID=UPI002240C87A|nr:ABC transporter substrate-binding protein [Oerskovia sp. JB1-3-2]